MLMIGKQLSAEQRLTKAVVDIMSNPRYVALAGILMLGDRSVCDKTRTAMTNGRDEKYGRKFIETLNDAELRFVVLHECYHKLYRHLTTWKHLYATNAMKANVACDHVINIKIADENPDGFAKMPMKDGKPVGVLDIQYRGMDSAQVYHALPQDDDGSGGGSGGEDGGLDSHDWEGAQDMPDEERKQLERDIDEAVRQGVLAAGKLGTGGRRDLDALLTPKVDWRDALREFINTTCAGNDYSTWRRPNRRFVSSGHYMPSGVSERVGELVIAIDTSGSIGGRELSQFLGEVKSICATVKPEAVRLLYWDTQVCADEKYADADVENIASSTKPAGGGGTDVRCVPKHITDKALKAQAVVVLTDGHLGGRWGQWTLPVLWCIMGNNSAMADVGKTIHIQD